MAENTLFVVEVILDQESGCWTASCDALGLVAEAQSYEELTKICWSLVADLIEMNEIAVATNALRLQFEHVEAAQEFLVVD